MSQEEFERIKAAIEQAANVLDAAVMVDGRPRFDFLIVAVPLGMMGPIGSGTNISMMASVPAEHLPSFMEYIATAYRCCSREGRVIDNTPAEGVVPS